VKVLLVHPGASWSTADVSDGLRFGLASHGVQIVDYRLDARIARASKWLRSAWLAARKSDPTFEKPNSADIFYQASEGAIGMALRHQVDVVLVVSAMFLHPDVLIMLRRAGVPVTILFTESPYDEPELRTAKLVDGCWTNERSAVEAFRAVNPRSGYVPHAWHPLKHRPGAQETDAAVPAHDVVFVGSPFRERTEWFSAIDWTGIDLGIYGQWFLKKMPPKLRPFLRGGTIDNRLTAALYRRAKIGLNLYRTSQGWGTDAPSIEHAESMNPRAYELAACGAFHISSHREEVGEVFGDLVPTFTHPTQASALIRSWLADPQGRARVSSELPARVAEMSWVERSAQIIGDLQSLLADLGRKQGADNHGESIRQERRSLRVAGWDRGGVAGSQPHEVDA
jgi:spore maturation protein CgeB